MLYPPINPIKGNIYLTFYRDTEGNLNVQVRDLSTDDPTMSQLIKGMLQSVFEDMEAFILVGLKDTLKELPQHSPMHAYTQDLITSIEERRAGIAKIGDFTKTYTEKEFEELPTIGSA